jgi:LmbE family N-acetylglucosaminyl deacetylase
LKAGHFFQLIDELPLGDWRTLTGGFPFVVLSPHPDDESLGAGGLIALARRHGTDVAVVLVTDGSISHPNSRAYPRERLVTTRRAELVEAAAILGVAKDRLFELGLQDAAVPLEGPEFEQALETVGAIVMEVGARSIFVTWEHDQHCDHEAAARLARALRQKHQTLRLWSYPVWGWHLPASQEVVAPAPAGYRLDIDEVLAQKRAAIAAHVSQMTDLISDDQEGFRFDEKSLAPFLRPLEHFVEVPSE